MEAVVHSDCLDHQYHRSWIILTAFCLRIHCFSPREAGSMAAVRGAARAFENEELAMFGKEAGAIW